MDHVRALKDQNARLRRDNERFVRLVDSGSGARRRAGGAQPRAGRVLREERRQLEELIKNIKSEKDGFVKDAMMQAQEARGLKDRLVSGNFVQRNKLEMAGVQLQHHPTRTEARHARLGRRGAEPRRASGV